MFLCFYARRGLHYEADYSGAFDCHAQHLLMFEASSSYSARKYSSFFCLEFAKRVGVFEIDVFYFGFTETAYFGGACSSFPSPSLTFIVLHVISPYNL
jgi:hypothetical protein